MSSSLSPSGLTALSTNSKFGKRRRYYALPGLIDCFRPVVRLPQRAPQDGASGHTPHDCQRRIVPEEDDCLGEQGSLSGASSPPKRESCYVAATTACTTGTQQSASSKGRGKGKKSKGTKGKGRPSAPATPHAAGSKKFHTIKGILAVSDHFDPRDGQQPGICYNFACSCALVAEGSHPVRQLRLS